MLQTAVPWRTFRWRQGQKHFPGTYWCATEQDHVIYESRLELLRLVLADFDTAVRHIVALVDLVCVGGGEQWPAFLGILRRGGRYVTAGAIAGPIAQIDCGRATSKT
ncbi:hypothetical protein ACWDKQ_11460 [Saccharopolyspora sp. NPDC000995]